MKIAIVYFEEKLSEDRSHHSVGSNLLHGWQRFYDESGSVSLPCLLIDKKTHIPNFWKYDVLVVKDDTPNECKDVLNKVGWIKHQAYDLLGKCVVMDLDAIMKSNIDDLADIQAPIAMAPDEGTYKNWHWNKDWVNAKHKYNAGVIYMNDQSIGYKFHHLWNEYIRYLDITYFDEIIFSSLMTELNGQILDTSYNTTWSGSDTDSAKVLHFSGRRKQDLHIYLNTHHHML